MQNKSAMKNARSEAAPSIVRVIIPSFGWKCRFLSNWQPTSRSEMLIHSVCVCLNVLISEGHARRGEMGRGGAGRGGSWAWRSGAKRQGRREESTCKVGQKSLEASHLTVDARDSTKRHQVIESVVMEVPVHPREHAHALLVRLPVEAQRPRLREEASQVDQLPYVGEVADRVTINTDVAPKLPNFDARQVAQASDVQQLKNDAIHVRLAQQLVISRPWGRIPHVLEQDEQGRDAVASVRRWTIQP